MLADAKVKGLAAEWIFGEGQPDRDEFRLHKNSDMLLSRDGLAHRCEYLLIRWESHPPLFRYHLIAYPDAELAAIAFDQFRLYS